MTSKFRINIAVSNTDWNNDNRICISSGLKRGGVDASEQRRYELPSLTLANDFQLVGLGQLIAAIEASDRYIEFPA